MREERFHFWIKGVTYANIFAILIGLLVAFAGNSIVFALHNHYTGEVFFDGQTIPPNILNLKNWLFGIIGGTIVGFHLLMVFISEYALKKKEKWAYVAMWAGLLSWFLIDTSLSIIYGAEHNVLLINLPALIMIGIPLFMCRKAFAS